MGDREAYLVLLKLHGACKSPGLLVEIHLLVPLAWVGPEVLPL